jgi:hypothetical protein
MAFIVTAHLQSYSAPAEIVPPALAPAAAAYYSRGPPLV